MFYYIKVKRQKYRKKKGGEEETMSKGGILVLPPGPSSRVLCVSLPVPRGGCCLSLGIAVCYSDYVRIIMFFHL